VRRHLLVGHAPHDVRPALTHAIEFQRLSWQARERSGVPLGPYDEPVD
jgi:hypothetical protein